MRDAGTDGASDAAWSEAHRRELVIRPLAAKVTINAETAANAAANLGLGRSRLFELIRAYRASPELASLLPGKRGRVRGERRLPSEQEDLISRALREVYLTAEKPNMASVRRWLRHECLKADVPIPSLKALRARIVALPQKDIIAAREGARAEALMKEHSRIARRNLREAVSEPGSHAVPGVQLIRA